MVPIRSSECSHSSQLESIELVCNQQLSIKVDVAEDVLQIKVNFVRKLRLAHKLLVTALRHANAKIIKISRSSQ